VFVTIIYGVIRIYITPAANAAAYTKPSAPLMKGSPTRLRTISPSFVRFLGREVKASPRLQIYFSLLAMQCVPLRSRNESPFPESAKHSPVSFACRLAAPLKYKR